MKHRFPIANLEWHEKNRTRRPGYLEHCLRVGERIAGDAIQFTEDQLNDIERRFNPNRSTRRRKIRGLGDVLHWLFKPFARLLRVKCMDKKTGQLKPGSPCWKHQKAWNKKVPL
jgi:hypothetical protein